MKSQRVYFICSGVVSPGSRRGRWGWYLRKSTNYVQKGENKWRGFLNFSWQAHRRDTRVGLCPTILTETLSFTFTSAGRNSGRISGLKIVHTISNQCHLLDLWSLPNINGGTKCGNMKFKWGYEEPELYRIKYILISVLNFFKVVWIFRSKDWNSFIVAYTKPLNRHEKVSESLLMPRRPYRYFCTDFGHTASDAWRMKKEKKVVWTNLNSGTGIYRNTLYIRWASV